MFLWLVLKLDVISDNWERISGKQKKTNKQKQKQKQNMIKDKSKFHFLS